MVPPRGFFKPALPHPVSRFSKDTGLGLSASHLLRFTNS